MIQVRVLSDAPNKGYIMNAPYKFIRNDDGEEFTINANGTYSNQKMKDEFPNHRINEYSLETMRKYKSEFIEIMSS